MPQLSDDRGRTKVYQGPESIPDCSSWLSFHGELHPDTDPAAIFACHCDEVAAAVESLRSAASPLRPVTIKAISDLTILPAWNVHRALKHLLLLDLVAADPSTASKDAPEIPDLPEREILTRLKRAMNDNTLVTTAIAKAVNLPVEFVRTFMRARPAAFEMIKMPRKPLQWKLKEAFGSMFKAAAGVTGCSASSRARTRERRGDSKKAVAA